MLKKASNYFLQSYLFKIGFAVSIITAVIAFSSAITVTLILYYHFDPLVPLLLLAIFWLLIIGIFYLCYQKAQRQFEEEVDDFLATVDNVRKVLSIFSNVRRLFRRK